MENSKIIILWMFSKLRVERGLYHFVTIFCDFISKEDKSSKKILKQKRLVYNHEREITTRKKQKLFWESKTYCFVNKLPEFEGIKKIKNQVT